MKKYDPVLIQKADVIKIIFQKMNPDNWRQILWKPQRDKGLAFSPTNIALCKYWGKRNNELNLPVNSSLSITLPDRGAMTTLYPLEAAQNQVVLNGLPLLAESDFVKRINEFLNLFREEKDVRLKIEISTSLPIAAGFASSACGFASLVSALNDLFNWNLSLSDLSILARLGSGSATRSFWTGFVEWQAGVQSDGMDSHGEPLLLAWPALTVGLLSISQQEKPISSRAAMQRTVDSSLLYESWPKKVVSDLNLIKQAIKIRNIVLLGGTAESNALSMHATMLSAWPPICYFLPETIAAMQKIWFLRQEGLHLFFTQDAGPNLKLLFLEKDKDTVLKYFPSLEVIKVFE